MKKVAVVGIGIMGHGIADNFLKNNYEVYVWNRNKEKIKDLQGAKIAKTPREAAENADIIFEVTANDESSKSVWLGKNGILAGADPKKILIACGTLSIAWTDKLAKVCAKKKLTFFDMPMTGSRAGAEGGKLILMVGGNKQQLEKLKPILKAIAAEILYFGPAGFGMRFKLLLNTLQSIHTAAFGEVLRMAKKMSLNIKEVGEALSIRPGGVSTNLAWKNYQNEPKPLNFSTEWMTKDLKYTKVEFKNFPTPLLDTALKIFKKAVKKIPQKDYTMINKL